MCVCVCVCVCSICIIFNQFKLFSTLLLNYWFNAGCDTYFDIGKILGIIVCVQICGVLEVVLGVCVLIHGCLCCNTSKLLFNFFYS